MKVVSEELSEATAQEDSYDEVVEVGIELEPEYEFEKTVPICKHSALIFCVFNGKIPVASNPNTATFFSHDFSNTAFKKPGNVLWNGCLYKMTSFGIAKLRLYVTHDHQGISSFFHLVFWHKRQTPF